MQRLRQFAFRALPLGGHRLEALLLLQVNLRARPLDRSPSIVGALMAGTAGSGR
jgi:hypothetical protein